MSKARKEGGLLLGTMSSQFYRVQSEWRKRSCSGGTFIIENSNEEQPAGEERQARKCIGNKDAATVLAPKHL